MFITFMLSRLIPGVQVPSFSFIKKFKLPGYMAPTKVYCNV